MDAALYTRMELALTLTVLWLILMVVHFTMHWLKDYARYVHKLTVKVYKLQGGK